MELQEYKDLKLRRGTIHSVHWKRPLKNGDVLKDFRGRVEKETIGNFRIGIDYSNMAINKDKKTGSLPYGFFEFLNEIIYSPSSDTYQVRLTQTMNENLKPKTKYFLDGVEISKEELIKMNALGSRERKKEFNPKENPVFNLPLNYIIAIN
jgi:hypothetical protein